VTGPEHRFKDLRAIAHDERNRHKRQAGRAHIYALEIPFSVIVGAVIGSAVDDYFKIAPWGLAVFLIAGVAAAARAIYRVIQWQKTLDGPADGAVEMPIDEERRHDDDAR